MPSRIVSSVLDFIFPPRCISCRTFCKETLCPSCKQKFPYLPPSTCSLCARPLEGGDHLCGDCLMSEPPFMKLHAFGLYKGILAELIGRMKYRREERIADLLGEWSGDKLKEGRISVDLVVPVPLHVARLRERGFNQSARIADAIGRAFMTRTEKYSLIRARRTPLQTTLTREERMKNLRDAFQVLRPEKFDGKKILLVDDVYTTGSTLTAATKALLKAGAESVVASVAARAVS